MCALQRATPLLTAAYLVSTALGVRRSGALGPAADAVLMLAPLAGAVALTALRAVQVPAERWIWGSATPSWSTRLRMMSIARLIESPVTFVCLVGLPW